MSRSYRKTKIFGHASSSEKEDKRINNRMFRKKESEISNELVKEANADLEVSDETETSYPTDMDEIRSTWGMAKDGKGYWKGATAKSMRK
jgi:hypothetical protein